jgi:hypothetical protein
MHPEPRHEHDRHPRHVPTGLERFLGEVGVFQRVQVDIARHLSKSMLPSSSAAATIASFHASGNALAILVKLHEASLRRGIQDQLAEIIAKPTGTVSLEIDRLRPLLVAKVRGAASARIRSTLRLRERIRHQFEGASLHARPERSPRRSTGSRNNAAARPHRSTSSPPKRLMT